MAVCNFIKELTCKKKEVQKINFEKSKKKGSLGGKRTGERFFLELVQPTILHPITLTKTSNKAH